MLDDDTTVDIQSRIETEFGPAYLNQSGRYVVRIRSNLYIQLSRLVCEKYVCDDLRNKEVHHIDGDKTNNDPSNLQVLSPTQHKLVHEEIKRKIRAEKRARRKGAM